MLHDRRVLPGGGLVRGFFATGATEVAIGSPHRVLVVCDGDRVEIVIGGYRWEFSGLSADPNTQHVHTLAE
jgi:hypothetical protein